MRTPLAAAALLALALLPPAVAPVSAQCSMCKATVENSEEGRQRGAELNRAIMVMFLAPYAVFGTCATVLFRRRLLGLARRLRHGPHPAQEPSLY